MPFVFAVISPHPPILLPNVGSPADRQQLKKTLDALNLLEKKFNQSKPDSIIISSPHPDWGFNVPLYFFTRHSFSEGGLAKDFVGKIEKDLIGLESPQFYFEQGQKVTRGPSSDNKKIGIIASGDLSHCLKEDGPYGFHPDGPKFDEKLIEHLKNKDIDAILKLDETYPDAGECGLRSFCFLLGMLEAAKLNWQPEILSYECPFGVGYLVANFKIL